MRFYKNDGTERTDDYGTVKQFWFKSGRQPSQWATNSEFRLNCYITISTLVIVFAFVVAAIIAGRKL